MLSLSLTATEHVHALWYFLCMRPVALTMARPCAGFVHALPSLPMQLPFASRAPACQRVANTNLPTDRGGGGATPRTSLIPSLAHSVCEFVREGGEIS